MQGHVVDRFATTRERDFRMDPHGELSCGSLLLGICGVAFLMGKRRGFDPEKNNEKEGAAAGN